MEWTSTRRRLDTNGLFGLFKKKSPKMIGHGLFKKKSPKMIDHGLFKKKSPKMIQLAHMNLKTMDFCKPFYQKVPYRRSYCIPPLLASSSPS
jgi:hypothetical protein